MNDCCKQTAERVTNGLLDQDEKARTANARERQMTVLVEAALRETGHMLLRLAEQLRNARGNG